MVEVWNEPNSPHIDPTVCRYCTGLSAERKPDNTILTSQEWCQKYNVCAATIDWDAVYGHPNE